MSLSIFGSPPKPAGFTSWDEWATQLADFLELQGNNLATLSLTGLAAVPTVMGYQQVVGAPASTSLTVPSGTTVAFIQPELQNIRWRDDGVDPTATVGNLVVVGETFMYAGDLSQFRMIEVLPSATVNVEYRR